MTRETVNRKGNIMSFFPNTNAKSNGANFTEQNRKCGNFTGIIKDIREIHSNSNNTVFGVIEIEVAGEPGVFQDYLNFNPAKATESMGYLVAHCKSAILSAGQPISNPDEEKDMAWVETSYQKLRDGKMPVHFQQSMNSRGQLNINFTTASETPENAGF